MWGYFVAMLALFVGAVATATLAPGASSAPTWLESKVTQLLQDCQLTAHDGTILCVCAPTIFPRSLLLEVQVPRPGASPPPLCRACQSRFTPDASSSYGAQWTRDFAYALRNAPDLFGGNGSEVTAASIQYTFAGQRADGCMPDRVQADGACVRACAHALAEVLIAVWVVGCG
jgi:hypothetical protein